MEFGLRLETQQKLMMTQELRQAIAILQLSTQELAQMVEQQFLENPVLEMDTGADSGESPAAELVSDGFTAADIKDLDNYFKSEMRSSSPVNNTEAATTEPIASRAVSLYEHLQFQVNISLGSPQERMIGHYIIGCIDHKGYLCSSTEEVALATGSDPGLVEEVLKVIQTFDPEGVGARNLQECLQIQARQRGLDNGLVAAIIQGYLPDLAGAKYHYIAGQLRCTPREVQEAADIIRGLNPKPGLAYSTECTDYVAADVTVKQLDGVYVIVINDYGVPRLTINQSYRQALRQPDSDVQKYVESKFNAAVWLLRSIEQRRNTLYRVTEAILDLQRGFFEYGPRHMQPLIMKTVADRLGVHESTVSRTVANKYIDTPYGLFMMRSFFVSCVQTFNGEQLVSSRIKQEMKKLLEGENAASPLSDQAISILLGKQGITISRRTVTKYREEMGIASSNKRKRY